MVFETENLEFKVQFTEEIYKEVIAFANTDGGVVYVGIDDSGNAVGLTNVDDEYTRITNGIRDTIQPDITMFIKYTIQENKVVRITVGEGANKPYFLRSKGLKPSGVYVRQGTSSVQASFEQIRQMIKENDGDSFEEMRSMHQELTFDSAKKTFESQNVEFNSDKYMALGITDIKNSLFTNLAFILSDQCEHTVKVAVFGDDMNTTFKDSREFRGSVFSQLESTFQYLMLCNKTQATINGLQRIEKTDYPVEAVREALLNALVHRDYSFSGSVIINVNDNEMEFISIGGLVSGLSAEDIRAGISQPRNRKMAEVFHRLHFIESYGTGIRRIYHLYKDAARQPEIIITPNTFKLILPNMNVNTVLDAHQEKPPLKITPQMNRVIDYIREHSQITDSDIQELLSIKKTRAYNLMREMAEIGLIKPVGRGKDKKYVFIE